MRYYYDRGPRSLPSPQGLAWNNKGQLACGSRGLTASSGRIKRRESGPCSKHFEPQPTRQDRVADPTPRVLLLRAPSNTLTSRYIEGSPGHPETLIYSSATPGFPIRKARDLPKSRPPHRSFHYIWRFTKSELNNCSNLLPIRILYNRSYWFVCEQADPMRNHVKALQ